MDKRRFIKNIRSSQVINDTPKLPTAEQIDHGEIAINFAKGYETLSIKNDQDEIVPFDLRSVEKISGNTYTKAESNALLDSKQDTLNSNSVVSVLQLQSKRIVTPTLAASNDLTIQGKGIKIIDLYNHTSGETNCEISLKDHTAKIQADSLLISNKFDDESDTNLHAFVIQKGPIDNDAILMLMNTDEEGELESGTLTIQNNASVVALHNNVMEIVVLAEDGVIDLDASSIKINNVEFGKGVKTINNESILGEGNIEIKGNDIAIADSYSTVTYPAPFESKVENYHITKDDKVDTALLKIENTFKTLSEEVVNNELVTTNAINNLADAMGAIASDDSIAYDNEPNSHYIKDALSLHHATMLLDNALNDVVESIKNVNQLLNERIKQAEELIDTKIKNLLLVNPSLVSPYEIGEFNYYIGTSTDEHVSQSLVDSLIASEGLSSVIYSTVTTYQGAYIWLLLPAPMELNSWSNKGMPITTNPTTESIEIDGKIYNAYRNLVPLEANTWDLTISINV